VTAKPLSVLSSEAGGKKSSKIMGKSMDTWVQGYKNFQFSLR